MPANHDTRTIAVTGASGLVGSRLVAALQQRGAHVKRLVRKQPDAGSGEIFWEPQTQAIDAPALEGLDAVVHLAGDNIAEGRWTQAKKDRILRSRTEGTQLLCRTLAACARPPKVVVSASAIGFYGSRGDQVLDENAAAGSGFLAEVCRRWEAATEPLAGHPTVRLVSARIGVVLSPAGGALGKMLLPFRLGLGGVIGNGKQYVSWIAIDDLVAAFQHILLNETLRGPVNLTSPNPVTNRELTKTLGRVLRRPTALPMPAFAARLAFGEMADEMLLSSTRVQPERLLESRFRYGFPVLEAALRHLLAKAK